MSKIVITISREFGSGGRSIGKAVAKALNIPYYDRELINEVAEKTGFSPEYIAEAGEYSPGKSIFSYFQLNSNNSSVMGGMNASDYLWCKQREVILDLAEKGSCVIVGRCADYILKDHPDAFCVFIHADSKFKAERIVRLYGETDHTPEERLAEKDKKRSIHYKHFTGREWGRCQNYNLSLDSSRIGIDECASLIVNLVQR